MPSLPLPRRPATSRACGIAMVGPVMSSREKAAASAASSSAGASAGGSAMSQAAVVLLVAHWLLTPLVVHAWTKNIPLAGFLSFIMILQLWSLYAIANQLELYS